MQTKNVVTFARTCAIGLMIVGVLASCATRNSKFVEIDEATRNGNFQKAIETLEENTDSLYGARDGVLYYLDSGMLHFYNRNYERSIRQFHEAERLIEEYFTKSVSQAATSLLLNDNQIDYAGEDFEDIYLNVFSAIAFMEQGDFEGAFVEVRRINNKLNLLEDKDHGLAA